MSRCVASSALYTLVATSSCILTAIVLFAASAALAGPPNFVVILIDDQSWVGTSLQIDPGDERSRSDYYRTPNIESLASEGMRFVRGYAPAPYCCPTRRSLLIGQTPARHIYQKSQETWLESYREQLTIPKMLKDANPTYRSAHFGKWDMRFDDVTPEQLGYDVSDGVTTNREGGGRRSGGPASTSDPKEIFGVTDRASKFMADQVEAGRPFFMQVSHYAVHLDIYYQQRTLDETYEWHPGAKHSMPEFAAMTMDVDTGIGVLLDKIESLGIEDSTYVFFLSDNGGRNQMPGQSAPELHRNDPLRDGKGSVYEGGIRVPFIVRGPKIAAGSVCSAPVTGLDLFPTIAELADYQQSLPEVLDGGSITGVLFNEGQGDVERGMPFLIFHQAVARSPESALIFGDYKLVKDWTGDKVELFDLSEEQIEQRDISMLKPDKTAELYALLTGFLAEVGAETRKTGTKKQAYERATSGFKQPRELRNVDNVP